MREPVYLFDASSVVRALKEARLAPLGGQALQWLTVYEVLNAFWKEVRLLSRLSPKEADSLISDFTLLLRDMVVLEPNGLEDEIFRIAVSRDMTVYDASYVALAAKHGLVLVTEDRIFSRKASGIVDVAGLSGL